MAEVVKVPIVGPVKREWAYVGAALTAGIVGYAWFSRARMAPAEDSTDVLDPGEAAGYDAFGNPIASPEYVPPTVVGSTGTFDQDQPIIRTNADWTQAAQERLITYGFDPAITGPALGRFLARSAVSSADVDIIRTAVAVAGPPPEGGPWTIPQPTAPTATTAPGTVTGLRAIPLGGTRYRITWEPVAGAKDYVIRHVGGSTFIQTNTVYDTQGATPGRTDVWEVAARSQGNDPGPFARVSIAVPAAAASTRPASVTTSAVPGARARVAWSAVPSATSYRVRSIRLTVPGSWHTVGNVTSYTTVQWPVGTVVSFEVSALVGGSWGPGRSSNTVRIIR